VGWVARAPRSASHRIRDEACQDPRRSGRQRRITLIVPVPRDSQGSDLPTLRQWNRASVRSRTPTLPVPQK